MLRLGVMGGTFDPIHHAHLIMAEEARMRYGLDQVIFIPAARPPHKQDYDVSDPEHRFAMTLLGTATNPHFDVSRIEIEREGPSYTVDTIRQLKGMHEHDTEIYFILGADEALDLSEWYEAESLPALARFIAVPRPEFDLRLLEWHVPERFMQVISIMDMTQIGISSTQIRARVTAGESIRYLVPESVESYIYKHGLYAGGKQE